MALSYIIPSIAENYEVGFGASAEVTALLFLTPAAVAQLISAPLIGRLAVQIGFVTVLRAGLIGAVPIAALLAIFAFDRNVVVLLIRNFWCLRGTPEITSSYRRRFEMEVPCTA